MESSRFTFDRRRFLSTAASSIAFSLAARSSCGWSAEPSVPSPGAIRGEPTAEAVGAEILADGGNAVDAIVAAALTAAMAAPYQTGIGGYGGAMVLAIEGGRRLTAIDFNSAAPRAMAGKISAWQPASPTQGGTIHLSAADSKGNLAALTLTHGEAFGAKVTVPGLGLTLGHGMSRFDPQPGHPNGPGPGKRPLHNMCPTIVTQKGQGLLAVGGRGGRRIPNAVCDVLVHFVVHGRSLEDSVAAPRIHTEGGTELTMEKHWPEAMVEAARKLGYQVHVGSSATISGARAGLNGQPPQSAMR